MYAKSGGRADAARRRDARRSAASRLREAGCVFAEEEARLLTAAAPDGSRLAEMVELRASGLPLEQVLGWAELAGVRVALSPGVFIPRHRTELLVREAAALAGSGMVVLDLCCGSGAIGMALSARVPGLHLHAVDVDAAAAACATRNLAGLDARVYLGDLFEPLPAGLRGRVDLLTVNAPYVPTPEIDLLPREARLHEPLAALDGGPDGLDVYRRTASEAPAWLAARGFLLVEVGEHQVTALRRILEGRGFAVRVAQDVGMEATVVVAAAPAALAG